MTHTTTRNTTAPGASTARSYTLPEAHRQAILGGSDSARRSAFLHAQRENFMSKNGGREFGKDYDASAAKNACIDY